ncbi:NCS2 family nucleobase:cation symporter [Macrococcoides bohemicum]|uniref:NCS2 family nucleobase:cation symporter n=1 Tax=Macrococcoides bohemicum TaxID=1903056 RepID=A0A4R5Y7T7_9STAP|nr:MULTISPECIES: solute carrier family 23 protein [Macrococcus]ATD30689.1 uracil permease [Macrococcus sp. IME1552]QRN49595.1 uracil permease [Macrococcus bohemicus]QYA43328.1 NCS2 family nucleobase:cation symporter [Macrococcus bohemicus]QYA45701.1 NCS2 family nucleobase:cation symporter [Macrococcus bohemicus]TDL39162.1 uracil permease [Macrococcus bohemicus]
MNSTNEEIYERTVEPVLDVNEKPKASQWFLLSSQHLFAMFGATVLVPYLTGLPVSAALIASGLGTLLYILITKGKIPAYLGSSFAFITPIIVGLKTHEMGEMLMALFMSGLMYVIIGLIIKMVGVNWLLKLLPPVVVGPVIMVIGLGLAPVAVNMAMYTDSGAMKGYNLTYLSIALITLLTVIIFSVAVKGFLSIIPVLIGIIVGYITSIILGVVDFTGIEKAQWFEAPKVYLPYVNYEPQFDWVLIMIMLPIVFVTVSEHIGHQIVINKIVGRNFFKNPGLHRSLMGDGISTMVASLIGGPPSTTYGENIGVLAITRIYSIWVIGGAAVLALILGFVGKFTALVSSIPTPVMGGVSILLFGIIASSGLRMLVESKVDFGDKRNLVIASVILVLGIGKAHIDLTVNQIHLNIEGMALAALAGIILNAILPESKTHEDY